ncbi:DUF1007 family protein [Arsenophonus sp. PmNCSU2021_1]|uniref:DUF1007 family protein n=1 Tax=Arsenophonus sp. PmNCSU2021_1 TaxID=3118989 RepID=UPI003FA5E04A
MTQMQPYKSIAIVKILLQNLLMALTLCYSITVFAHPHSFIDMQNELQIKDGNLIAMKMTWVMDAMPSADLLYDAQQAKESDEVWKQLSAEVMANVIKQRYFTSLYYKNKLIKFSFYPKDYHLSRKGKQAVLSFTLKLAKPETLTGKTLTIMTYDPSYYVDMTYSNKAKISSTNTSIQCQIQLIAPKPSASIIDYALSLDKAERPQEDLSLGQQFAQKVNITCQ